MSLLAEIEKLHARRETLAAEIAAIDDELERAGFAITGHTPRATQIQRRQRDGELRAEGSIPNLILDALAHKEPQTLNDIAASVGNANRTYLNIVLRNMVNAGRLHRARLTKGSGLPMIYARSAEALVAYCAPSNGEGHRQEPEQAAEADDELG